MFTKKINKKETTISVDLDEPLTSNSCSKLIVESMKYILYQKQQIPFPYDTLLQLQKTNKPTNKNNNTIKNLLATIELITDELTCQLHTNECDVREVIIVIGATPVSPKFLVKFELPDNILSSKKHMEYQHSYRKPLLTLMRCLIKSDEFQDAMALPQGPTNTFVLVQKSDSNTKSDFFLPKPQYTPPIQTSTCISIKIKHNDTINPNCTCMNIVKIHHDNDESSVDDIPINIIQICTKKPYLWYQSKEVVKGFKYIG